MKLTKTEFNISALITAGFEVKEVARKVNRSIFTVQTHVKNIRKKNKLKNLAEISREFTLNHGDPTTYISSC
ncbi:helix-turn-helix transcriptional regulator [Tenacibaculum sp. MEBiC06402]|uniref:helix-turn-helix transcriptional regulator n=1 Tax=unclassified Tenacibaculum TaxID=2635139 RepID=UPI003B9BA6D5